MEDEERGPRLSKRFNDKNENGEVDYKTKSGTAWSHSFLNQKPWHPLSYPNQRRKWIAEQTHAQHDRRALEIAREYTQEQEFLRQTTLLSQKEKEKVDIMQAVSFMYVRPPGYNAESAKAAEVADQRKDTDPAGESSSSAAPAVVAELPVKEEKRKARPKDVFGRALPTEEEFAVLKNAPRLETGQPGRAKPFAIELRNVKCVRCGTFGHQSGDRECPLKDVIMPNEESRLKRDDPLTAIVAHMDSSEPLKWELKQKPGISPPRGGFMPDDPNQQIVAEEIFDEYGGFLSAGNIPDLLANFSSKKKSKSKSKHKKEASSRQSREGTNSASDDDDDNDQRRSRRKYKKKSKHKKQSSSQPNAEETESTSDSDEHHKRSRSKAHRNKNKKNKGSPHCGASEDSEGERYSEEKQGRRRHIVEESDFTDRYEYGRGSREREHKSKKGTRYLSDSSLSGDSEHEKGYGKDRHKHLHQKKQEGYNGSSKRTRESGISYEHRLSVDEKSRVKEGINKPDTSRRTAHRDGENSSDNSDTGTHNERDRRKSRPERTHRDLRSSHVDGLSDDERNCRKSEKLHKRHKTSRHDLLINSSNDLEPNKHHEKQKDRHSKRSAEDGRGSEHDRKHCKSHHYRSGSLRD